MNVDELNIPWPKYRFWTYTTVMPGCVAVIATPFITAITEAITHRWLPAFLCSLLIAMLIGLSPLLLLGLINFVIYLVWLIRIGRITTWSGVRRITQSCPNDYQILV